MPGLEATRKKLREAAFFYSKLADEERHIFRPEPEARDFYLSAFLAAARSAGDVVAAEAGDHYRAWYANRKKSLPQEESRLLRFTDDQRIQTVHVRGVQAENQRTEVPLYELQMEMRAKGGDVQYWSPPGTPHPTTIRTTLFFVGYPEEAAVQVCQRYLRLLERLLSEYEAHAAV